MASYRELRAWKKAIDLVTEVYRLCKLLPKEETYGLSDQMRRAVVSIPSNIAEGQARESLNDFIRFLHIAQGSRAELETQLEICVQLNYISREEMSLAERYSAETGRMIRKLITALQNSPATPNKQPSTTNH